MAAAQSLFQFPELPLKPVYPVALQISNISLTDADKHRRRHKKHADFICSCVYSISNLQFLMTCLRWISSKRTSGHQPRHQQQGVRKPRLRDSLQQSYMLSNDTKGLQLTTRCLRRKYIHIQFPTQKKKTETKTKTCTA